MIPRRRVAPQGLVALFIRQGEAVADTIEHLLFNSHPLPCYWACAHQDCPAPPMFLCTNLINRTVQMKTARLGCTPRLMQVLGY